ncbi:hypothetical protein CYMTET_3261 [Cymbomonas tetramitiformis]|uniref:Uncharacterized protein n=1 Tax=Cymbomonas tetramitiformis TaxID=36881 RepID=A0AAE0H3G5_9CHLO|nr:hypothetical protein CYMTET_3261 [Cymbomonas tetramitiformis]
MLSDLTVVDVDEEENEKEVATESLEVGEKTPSSNTEMDSVDPSLSEREPAVEMSSSPFDGPIHFSHDDQKSVSALLEELLWSKLSFFQNTKRRLQLQYMFDVVESTKDVTSSEHPYLFAVLTHTKGSVGIYANGLVVINHSKSPGNIPRRYSAPSEMCVPSCTLTPIEFKLLYYCMRAFMVGRTFTSSESRELAGDVCDVALSKNAPIEAEQGYLVRSFVDEKFDVMSRDAVHANFKAADGMWDWEKIGDWNVAFAEIYKEYLKWTGTTVTKAKFGRILNAEVPLVRANKDGGTTACRLGLKKKDAAKF